MRPVFAILLFIFSCKANATAAATRPFVLGVTDTISSAILGEQRIINVYLPAGYSKDSARTYPVIYLLDGSADEDFIHVAGLVQFLSGIVDTIPGTIVVGIANVSRQRDFTAPSPLPADRKLIPKAGGSGRFVDFIEKELQPYVERHYKVSAIKSLVGQSLGGLLATEILLKRPALFTNYFIISPSLWWAGEALLKVPAPSFSGKNIFIATGEEEEKQMIDDARALYGLLLAKNSKTSSIVLDIMPGESHLTILHNALYKGFERLLRK